MIKISIIGSGNVAQHLITAFQKSADIELIQVYARHKETISTVFSEIKITNNFNELIEADLYIISVSDDAVAEISSQLPFQDRLVVHTSGSVPLVALNNKNRKGVFYPLQTFTKNKKVDFKTIPLCLESEHKEDFIILEKTAQTISDNIYPISSEQRKALHVAAVFVNNFVNHLYQIGNEICIENEISFDILKPLITETTNKIMNLSPKEAQTGPAKRKDKQTIAKHIAFLDNELYKEIYKNLTQSIQTNHGTKL